MTGINSTIRNAIYQGICKDVAGQARAGASHAEIMQTFKDGMIKHGAIQMRTEGISQYELMPILADILDQLISTRAGMFILWDMLGGTLDELVLKQNTPVHQMKFTVAVAFVIRCQETVRASAENDLINRMMFAY
jgi:hypothetical protein